MNSKHAINELAIVFTSHEVTEIEETSINLMVRSVCPCVQDVILAQLNLEELEEIQNMVRDDGLGDVDKYCSGMRTFYYTTKNDQLIFDYLNVHTFNKCVEGLLLKENKSTLVFEETPRFH